MKKVLSLLCVAMLLITLFLPGCGKKSGDRNDSTPGSTSNATQTQAKNVTLRVAWWGNQTRNDRTQQVIDLFMKKYPNITIQAEFVDWNGYWSKLATQASGKSLPDVIQMDYSYIGQYVEKKLLLDLTPYTTNGILDISNITENIIDSGKLNGGLYGISLGTNALALFYDPAVFQAAGIDVPKSNWTWEEYEEIITKVYNATGKQVDPIFSTDPSVLLQYFARQSGYPLFSADGTSLGFTDPKIAQKVFDQVHRLTQAKVFVSPDKVPTSTAVEEALFVKGQTFMGSGWSNQFVATAVAANRPLAMISLPLGGTGKGLFDKPSMFFSVSADSQYKEEAVKFVDFFTNDIEANKILLAERGVPVSSKVREAIKPFVDEYTAATFDYINQVDNIDKLTGPIDPPSPSGSAQVVQLMKDLYDQVAFGRIEPAAAAEQFMKQANEILAKSQQ